MENGFEWTYRIGSLWLQCLQSLFSVFLKWSLSSVLTILLIKFSPNVWSKGKFLMHSVKIWIAWFPRKIQKAIKLIVRKSFLLCHNRQPDSELDKLNERRKVNVLRDSCGTTIWFKKMCSDNTYDHGPYCCQRLFTRSKSSNCLPTSQGYEHFNNFYRPQRSCGQGNVFTAVCDSVHGGGSPAGRTPPTRKTPPGRENLPGQGEPPRHGPPQQGEPPPRHTVNERPVRILLECILVTILFCIAQSQWIWHLQDKYPDNDGVRFIKEYDCIYDFEE